MKLDFNSSSYPKNLMVKSNFWEWHQGEILRKKLMGGSPGRRTVHLVSLLLGRSPSCGSIDLPMDQWMGDSWLKSINFSEKNTWDSTNPMSVSICSIVVSCSSECFSIQSWVAEDEWANINLINGRISRTRHMIFFEQRYRRFNNHAMPCHAIGTQLT